MTTWEDVGLKLDKMAADYEASERKVRERIKELRAEVPFRKGRELEELQARLRRLYGMAQVARETAERLRKYYQRGEADE